MSPFEVVELSFGSQFRAVRLLSSIVALALLVLSYEHSHNKGFLIWHLAALFVSTMLVGCAISPQVLCCFVIVASCALRAPCEALECIELQWEDSKAACCLQRVAERARQWRRPERREQAFKDSRAEDAVKLGSTDDAVSRPPLSVIVDVLA
eukprot:CAMPEP_0171100236 /NCGR_PEP_ID=MMETSP0766_2-20121228/52840_1 /TAXON_ID=439317 /ORGANISM="Gambierdiscus australes, Strain CAWD 149" /LENGTH=151 /DNA_ID=CAMNT_0011560029 /DNA_START=73 /DNA_END=528 /DNA_ORIENTATION=+